MIVRPGPYMILPGLAPGGIVLRVYGKESGLLLSESRLTPGTDLDADAEGAVNRVQRIAPGAEIVLVVYDGDTGKRWSPADYIRAGFPPGRTV